MSSQISRATMDKDEEFLTSFEQKCSKKKINRTLTLEDRKEIQRLLHSGCKKKAISRILKIHTTTLFRELKRCKDSYIAEEAQKTRYQSKNLIDFDIIGKRFGLLQVKSFANIYKNRSWWNCMCDCGKSCVISRKMLAERCSDRRMLSCGCIPKQWHSKEKTLPLEELALRKYHDLLKFRKINGECWEWTGARAKGGTPRCSWRSKAMSVRKCMYLIFNGTEYEENTIYTTCGNLLCFNPEHLTLEPSKKRHYYER